MTFTLAAARPRDSPSAAWLGLRNSDVARLPWSDIEWQTNRLRVSGKGCRKVRLALPQEVGDAIISYLISASGRFYLSQNFMVRPSAYWLGGEAVINDLRTT
jgi:integrase